ncbi:MAG: glycosyltransferase family 39 protein, partial [Myxococcota bacterium]
MSEATPSGGDPRSRFSAQALVRPVVFGPLLFIAAAGISLWYASRGFPFQDEGSTLTAASKILDGAVFYRDIDAYPFPGAPYLLALCMSLFGEHLSVARGLAGLLYCASVLALYAASLQLVDRNRAALFGLCLLGFKFVGWPAFSTYNYSDVGFFFACLAISLLVTPIARASGLRMLLAGFCVAGAVASKQNLGIYLGSAAGALLVADRVVAGGQRANRIDRWKPLLGFALGVMIPLGAAMLYFAAQGLLGSLLYSGLIRPFTGYLPTGGISFSPMLAWWRLGELHDSAASNYFVGDYFQLLMLGRLPGPSWYGAYWFAGELFSRVVYSAIPAAYLWVIVRAIAALRRATVSSQDAKVFSVAVLSLAAVLSAFPRADFFHIISVFPALLLLLFALSQPSGARQRTPRIAVFAIVVGLGLCAVLSFTQRAQLTHQVRLARADVVVDPTHAWIETVVNVIEQEVEPDQPLFVYGHEAYLYFLTRSEEHT